jgi:hypothetical protein
MIGRFLNHQGTKDKIVPAVRFGNISVMLELIWNSTVSRPVEMRSRTGFSGSPAAGSRRQLAHSEVCGRPPEAQARIRGARRGASSPRRVSESGHRLVKARTHGARSNGETAQACDSRGKPRPRRSKGKSRAIRGGTQTINLCQYIRGQSDHGFPCRGVLGGAQILGSRLAAPAVCNDVERYSLALVERAHTGAFDRTDMNEDILVTVLRLNEAKALLVVKPLHSTRVHRVSFH